MIYLVENDTGFTGYHYDDEAGAVAQARTLDDMGLGPMSVTQMTMEQEVRFKLLCGMSVDTRVFSLMFEPNNSVKLIRYGTRLLGSKKYDESTTADDILAWASSIATY